jgi:pyrimidine-nucleoside phosphorylase
MRAVDLIQKKKEGQKHTEEEIYFLVEGYMKGTIEDYQMSAWLMAVCFKGLDIDETAWLTKSYIDSGEILNFSHISRHVADKHSTGGVGDKVTLVLIPLLASCGLTCAKLSGRALGYTGGTIDKLEAIENFNCEMKTSSFMEQIKKTGAAISAQTPNLTPADGKIYALRDVTATVDNKSLICASVVSKKIASGANHIVLDVKYGSGAFVKTKEEAQELAQLMIDVGKKLNRNIKAVISSMEQPLGTHIGNALEILESIEFIKGNCEKDLHNVTFKIASMLLISAGICKDEDEAEKMLEDKIKNGSALRKFSEIIVNQGGNRSVLEDYSLLKIDPNKIAVHAPKDGYVKSLKALGVAKACKIIGGGREKKTDKIDFGVGIILNKKIGDFVKKGDTLATIYATKQTQEACKLVEEAYEISNEKPLAEELIYKTMG